MTGISFPARRLVSQDDAAIIQRANVPRSKFLGSWTRKTAFDAGYLVPILVDEILPGDHVKYDVTAYVRMATPLYPMFDNQRIDTFFFFVPNRLVWGNWIRMMGEQDNPTDSIDYTVPVITGTNGGEDVGSIFDHMGIPVAGQITAGQRIDVNALPFRAYNLIWNKWFRDENLQSSASVTTTDGPDNTNLYALKYRAKAHDYFTSALPWPQKFTAPTISLGTTAPIKGLGLRNTDRTGPTTDSDTYETSGQHRVYAYARRSDTAFFQMEVSAATDALPMVYADLSAATGITINTLRQTFLIQQLLERDARGGSRYIELIKSHFGVTNPDFRLQRPEYIGGGQSPMNITPIAQTAPTTGLTVGALGGAGTGVGQHRASYAATEHGYVIGLINIRTELSYQQGLHKMWTRSTRYDFYWPSLAQLGEQAILRQEIYCNGDDSNDAAVFGYQERWHEYRTRYSEVTGIMRSTASGTIDGWHLAQKFATAPGLNDTFIKDNPPMSRILAAGTNANGQQYLADIMFHREIVRALPTFGTPATLGRF